MIGIIVAIVGGLALGLAFVWARRRFIVVTVIGGSMQPTLRPNDRVLAVRRSHPRHGIVVLTAPPQAGAVDVRPLRVKRLIALPGEVLPEDASPIRNLPRGATVPSGHVVVLGDHPNSEDSKQWGPIPANSVMATVHRRLSSGQPRASNVHCGQARRGGSPLAD